MQTVMTSSETDDDTSSIGARPAADSATTAWRTLLWPGCHGKPRRRTSKTHKSSALARELEAEEVEEGRGAGPAARRREYLGAGGSLDGETGEEHHGRLGPVVDADPAPTVRDVSASVDHQRGGRPSEERGVVGRRHGSRNPRVQKLLRRGGGVVLVAGWCWWWQRAGVVGDREGTGRRAG